MMGRVFANASAASPPAVYFAKTPPIIRPLPTKANIMVLIAYLSAILVRPHLRAIIYVLAHKAPENAL
jgi:hypothetical protein